MLQRFENADVRTSLKETFITDSSDARSSTAPMILPLPPDSSTALFSLAKVESTYGSRRRSRCGGGSTNMIFVWINKRHSPAWQGVRSCIFKNYLGLTFSN